MRRERYSVVTGGVRYWPTTFSNISASHGTYQWPETPLAGVRVEWVEPIHAPGPEPGNDAHPTEHIPLDRCWREGCGAQIERDDDVGLCQACVIELRDM